MHRESVGDAAKRVIKQDTVQRACPLTLNPNPSPRKSPVNNSAVPVVRLRESREWAASCQLLSGQCLMLAAAV